MQLSPRRPSLIDGKSILSTVVQSSVVELFRGHGIAVAPLIRGGPVPTLGEGYTGASVGFSGPVMTGTLTLLLPSVLFPLLLQPENGRPKEADYARELANQLTGRLKNRLHLYQIELRVALPTSTMATARLPRRDDSLQSLEYVFRFLRGDLYVTMRGNIDFAKIVYAGTRETANEGDVILF